MIKAICLNAFIVIHTILFCLWTLLLSCFVDKNSGKIHRYAIVPWAKIILWVCRIKVFTSGLENIIAKRPHIFMANHQSFFDIFVLLACLPVDVKFVFKKELMKIPIFGLALRRVGNIAIERKDTMKAIQSMNKAAESIINGASVVMFPEGTRSKDGRLLPFKKGGFHMAFRAGCDIIPVTICNSCRIVSRGSLKINKGVIHLHVGVPVSTRNYNEKNIEELITRVSNAVAKEVCRDNFGLELDL